jgi:hypothetical protein
MTGGPATLGEVTGGPATLGEVTGSCTRRREVVRGRSADRLKMLPKPSGSHSFDWLPVSESRSLVSLRPPLLPPLLSLPLPPLLLRPWVSGRATS